MLTDDQIGFFHTFGFLIRRQLFSTQEMDSFTHEAEAFREQELGHRPDESKFFHLTGIVEQRSAVRALLADDRLYIPLTQLLGDDFVWSGSECNSGVQSGTNDHHWHADRPGRQELSYPRIKIMLYLDPMRVENGAFRVIPGSHRSPLHEDLEPFQGSHADSDPTYFGLRGDEIPCQIMTTDPGDVVMFHHCLYHAVYAKSGRRRYIAFKFAAWPTRAEHIASHRKWQPGTLEPPEALRNSPNPRIRQMVEGLAELGAGDQPSDS